jgi:uncharacterized protein with HEPN domain
MRNDRERLLDIQEAIEDIRKYAVRGKDAFRNDELVQTWILHHLQILGEAASRISDDFQEQHPDVPWYKIIGMRNILVTITSVSILMPSGLSWKTTSLSSSNKSNNCCRSDNA